MRVGYRRPSKRRHAPINWAWRPATPFSSTARPAASAALPAQFAVERGARVIGVGSPATHDHLRGLRAEPIAYGEGMPDRVRAIAPAGVDLALDVAGNGILPELIDLAGGAGNVITIADYAGARVNGVRFSRGDSGRAVYALALVRASSMPGGSPSPSGRPSRSPTSPRRTASASREGSGASSSS